MLAAKVALAARVDAFGTQDGSAEMADSCRARLAASVKYWDVATQLNRGYHNRKQPSTYVPTA